MNNLFNKIFNKKPDKNNFDYSNESSEATAKRLLGVRSFEPISSEKKKDIFKTENLIDAYENLYTNTGGIVGGKTNKWKIEQKQGNVVEILKNKMIPEEILKSLSTVYLGSGTDIEYPLVLGSRNIVLFDPIFQNPESKKELFTRIEELIKEKLPENLVNNFSFSFDFGNGDEFVKVKIIPEYYTKETSVELPEKVGLVIMFASQSPNGQVEVESNLESKIVDGGAILKDHALIKIENDQKEIIELGK